MIALLGIPSQRRLGPSRVAAPTTAAGEKGGIGHDTLGCVYVLLRRLQSTVMLFVERYTTVIFSAAAVFVGLVYTLSLILCRRGVGVLVLLSTLPARCIAAITFVGGKAEEANSSRSTFSIPIRSGYGENTEH